jgi:hypothetical protein
MGDQTSVMLNRRPRARSGTAPAAISCVVALLLLVPLGRTAEAQYFGQNRVQWEQFDFQVLQTEHFDIYHYPEAAAAAAQVAQMAERWHVRLSNILHHRLTGRQPIILYAAHPHFRQTNAIPMAPGEGTGGVTEMFKRRVVLPVAGPLEDTDHVLGHELVHAFQFDITAQAGAGGGGGVPGALRLPLWFIEGMAEYLSLGPVDPNTALWMREAAMREALPTIRQLDDRRFFPYRYGHAFWAYVAGRWGDEVVGDLLRAAGRAGSAVGALERVLRISADELAEAWHESIHEAYRPILAATQAPEDVARPLIRRDRRGGALDIGPALSPDGRRLVFLSERDLFAIEMFLADAETGEVIRKLTDLAADAHFDSLQFLNYAGAWHPEGTQFAFVGVARGQPVITIMDVERGATLREIRVPDLADIFNPAWSPDAGSLAFTGMQNGYLNLYLYDLRDDSLRQVTNDMYSALQPAWSPDGRRIAFVTDRFTTTPDVLQGGHQQIAMLDVASGEVQRVPGFENARSMNPQWSPDGNSLFFIGWRLGIPNIYRLDLRNQQFSQVTNLSGGVSGITPASPALSVAASADRLVFGVFENNNYNIYALDTADALAGDPLVDLPTQAAGVLPPRTRGEGEIFAYLQDPRTGFVPPDEFTTAEYRPRLSLDYIGQPFLAVGADRFGAFAGGGVSFFFSDMLGDHNLAAATQVFGNFESAAGQVMYQNLSRRWNWAVIGQHVPVITGGFRSGPAIIDGQVVFVEQEARFTQLFQGGSGLIAYPFTRARRVEFSGGYQRVSFDQRVITRGFHPATGQELFRETERFDVPDALHLGQASAAMVFDTSFFGATSPIMGRRSRFELAQTAGTINFSGLLADYRQYFMPVRPFTLAARALHFGRYGPDSEDPRLFPLFLGYPELVRGYDTRSFRANECVPDDRSNCPVFDQLLGSRLLVGNVEFRFPPLGFIGEGYYGPLPLELALFADTGIAWTSGRLLGFGEIGPESDFARPSFLGGDRNFVSSVGISLRMNLFGYAIGGVNYVRPLDRPGRGWIWQFTLTPGF